MSKDRILYQKKLLKGYNFSLYQALKIVLFGMLCSSMALSFFAYQMGRSFDKSTSEVKAKLLATFEDVSALYALNYQYSDYLEGSKPLVLNPKAKLGAKDLTLKVKPRLVKVKGQKRKLSDNEYEIRFVRE